MDANQMVQFLPFTTPHRPTVLKFCTTRERQRNKRGTRDEQYVSSHDIHFSTNTVKSKGPLYNRVRAVGKYLSTGGWSVRGVCKDYFTNTWERNKPIISLGQCNSSLHNPKSLEAHTLDSTLQDGFTYSLHGGVISVIPSWFQTAKKCHKSFSTGCLALCWTSKLTNLAFPLRLSVWVDRALRCGVPGPVQISEDPGLTQPRCKKRSMTQCHPERHLTSYSFSQITWNTAKILNTTVSK